VAKYIIDACGPLPLETLSLNRYYFAYHKLFAIIHISIRFDQSSLDPDELDEKLESCYDILHCFKYSYYSASIHGNTGSL